MVMQSPDDFYERWIATTLIRSLRFSSIFITLFLSAFYISLVSFHQGMLPTALAVTIASTRENVPFPPLLEALIMEVTIELLREAGLRLPNPLGQTIGLVGGVVIGQAAVEDKYRQLCDGDHRQHYRPCFIYCAAVRHGPVVSRASFYFHGELQPCSGFTGSYCACSPSSPVPLGKEASASRILTRTIFSA